MIRVNSDKARQNAARIAQSEMLDKRKTTNATIRRICVDIAPHVQDPAVGAAWAITARGVELIWYTCVCVCECDTPE